MKNSNEFILFSFSADGGGSDVYGTNDGKVFEKGSSGGMLDEVEDPIISWKKEFENWEAWWNDFESKYRDWYYFYPIYIDDQIKDFIRKKINALTVETYSLDDWKRRLDGHEF